MNLKFSFVLFLRFFLLAALTTFQPEASGRDNNDIPHLRKQGTATQLIVDGKPFLILAGELGNSSASNLEYLKPFWSNFVKMNLNTILAPVCWELMESLEGQFDYRLVDGLIEEARRHDLRLVLLWFGSWKNSMSCYAPMWVKTDQERFPRARLRTGRGLEILSAFHEANRSADAFAFTALMRHLREVDAERQTVVMIQVENEVGMLEEARDWSLAANKAFQESVPNELMNYLKANPDTLIPEFKNMWAETGFRTSGTWEDVFGKGLHTDEIFMAWHYAGYINHIAEAGKAEYPLPMFVNAALIRPEHKPGQYPSAGPLPHIMDVWRAGAPQIDFLCPDIYFPNFEEWCRKYHRYGNPLFIPEAGRGNESAVSNSTSWPLTGGIIISTGPDDYIIAGSGVIVTFTPVSPGGLIAGIGMIDEGKYVDGRWVPQLRLTGDQSHQGRHLRIPATDFAIQKIKLYQYE